MTLDPAIVGARLAAFDGRSITLLGEIEVAFLEEPGYFEALTMLATAAEQSMSVGATWLIKSAFEAERAISVEQMAAYCQVVPAISGWAAQLHACQTIQYLQIEPEAAAELVEWLRPLLEHERPFLRAWSLDALSHIAIQHPAFDRLTRETLMAAEQDSAASVRARARQVRKRLD